MLSCYKYFSRWEGQEPKYRKNSTSVKRQEGEAFMEKERKVVKKYYLKASDLTKKKRKTNGVSRRKRE